MVDIVGELFLYPFFLKLLAQCHAVLPVPVGICLLQSGIQPDNVIRNRAELIVGEWLDIRNPRPLFNFFGETVQAQQMLSDAPGGKISENAHGDGDAPHHPQKAVIGPQQGAQRHGIR